MARVPMVTRTMQMTKATLSVYSEATDTVETETVIFKTRRAGKAEKHLITDAAKALNDLDPTLKLLKIKEVTTYELHLKLPESEFYRHAVKYAEENQATESVEAEF